jgi:hypothetical protein
VAVGLVTGPGAPQVSLRLLGHRAVTVRLALPVSPRTPAATPAAPGD